MSATEEKPPMNMAELRKRANRATVEEAAEICDVKLDELKRAIKEGELETHYGKLDLEDVDAWWFNNTRDVDETWHNKNARRRTEMARMFVKEDVHPAMIGKVMGIKEASVYRALQRAGIVKGEKRKWRDSEAEDKVLQFIWCQTLDKAKCADYFYLTQSGIDHRVKRRREQGWYFPELRLARAESYAAVIEQVIADKGGIAAAARHMRLAYSTVIAIRVRAKKRAP